MITHKQFIEICDIIARSSHCNRSKVGAILVKDGNIISMGYNGTPSGFDNNCEDHEGTTKAEVLHAEANALMKALCQGNSAVGAVLYTTYSPCVECAKLIIQAGITEVYYRERYRSPIGLFLLTKANIHNEQIF